MIDPAMVTSEPARPETVGDWEDLLVRFEIMPRVLRVTIEESALERAAAADVLRATLARETALGDWLERAAYGSVAATAATPAEPADPAGLADAIASRRARNFAMLQRRGLEVWDWTAPLGTVDAVTAYQMVRAAVALDRDTLARLRAGARLGTGAC